jgi:predicted dehydrogenase
LGIQKSIDFVQLKFCLFLPLRKIVIANLSIGRQNIFMNAQRKIRWGVLGYARIARESVIPAIQRSENSEFCAIASREESKLAECRARFPNAKVYHGYDELLRDPDLDAIYIPLPNSLHGEWTIKAAKHGKHVLCEKPIALSATECREMISVCATRRVTLMEAFMYRYTDRTRRVIEVLRSGELGEIKYVNSSFRFLLSNPASVKLKAELGGGSLYDVGCYVVNFAGLVADIASGSSALPESVSAECVREHGIDMICSTVLKYPNGLIASLNCGFNTHRRIFSEIVGTLGVLEVPDTFSDYPGALALITGDTRREIPVAQCERYRLEIEDFSSAILEGRTPRFTMDETLRNAIVMDQIFDALA